MAAGFGLPPFFCVPPPQETDTSVPFRFTPVGNGYIRSVSVHRQKALSSGRALASGGGLAGISVNESGKKSVFRNRVAEL